MSDVPSQDPKDSRFLSPSDCQALKKRILSYTSGGGTIEVSVESTWSANLRWGSNRLTASEDTRDVQFTLRRNIRGSSAMLVSNDTEEKSLRALVQRSEQLVRWGDEYPETGIGDLPPESYLQPKIWNDTTYGVSPKERSAVMQSSIQAAEKAQVVSAGYLEVGASGHAFLHSTRRDLYYPSTKIVCSITVRDENTKGSGWAGIDHHDWLRVDLQKIATTALDKCLNSRNPIAIEPSRYTVILEPQAVADFFDPVMTGTSLERSWAEDTTMWMLSPFSNKNGTSKIGQKIFDSRITVTSDPMDPDLGFVPFDYAGNAYRPAVWFDRGILRNLAYDRHYGIQKLGIDTGLPNSGSYRIHGGTTTLSEMIATTRRGLLITRFSNVGIIDPESMLLTGFTRDGVWLVENGNLTRPIRNFRFGESPMFALNSLDAIGPEVRVYHPNAPIVAPPMKMRDFNFVAIADAI